MKALVYYTDFLVDNHQGGSGTYLHSKLIVDIPDRTPAEELIEYINEQLFSGVSSMRSYAKDINIRVTKIEVFK